MTDKDPTWNDPIVEEVRRVREEYAARFGFDLKRIVEDLRQLEGSGEFEMVELSTPGPRPVEPGRRTGT